MRFFYWPLLAILLAGGILLGTRQNPEKEKLARQLEQWRRQKVFQHTTLGYIVVDPEAGEVLAAHRPDKTMATASVLKTVTTAAALELLGANHQFTTGLGYQGTINKSTGILEGHVVVQAGGDPTLGSDEFAAHYGSADVLMQRWAKRLKEAGIRQVTGQVILDIGLFDEQNVHGTWIYDDMGNYYGAGAGSMAWQDNMVHVYFQSPAQAGRLTTVDSLYPFIPELRVVNYVKSSDVNRDRAYIYSAPDDYNWIIRGTIPKNRSSFHIKGAMPEPWRQAGRALVAAMREAGIDIQQQVRSCSLACEHTAPIHILHTELSPRLDTLVQVTNYKSVNLYTEYFLRHVALAHTGYSQIDSTTKALQRFWKDQGMPADGMHLYDGCGLSRFNAISPRQLAFVFNHMQQSKAANSFKQSLPVAGQSGTLKYFGKGTDFEGQLMAKSGHISGVVGYAGYLKTNKGKELIAVVLANNYDLDYSDMKQQLYRFFNYAVAYEPE